MSTTCLVCDLSSIYLCVLQIVNNIEKQCYPSSNILERVKTNKIPYA